MPTPEGLDPVDLPEEFFQRQTLGALAKALTDLVRQGYAVDMPVKIGIVTPGARDGQLYVAHMAVTVGRSEEDQRRVLQLLIPPPPGYTPPPRQPQN